MSVSQTHTTAQSRILGAFESLIAEKPYGLITMQDIADSAKLNRVTVYRHFGTKEDMVESRVFNGFKDSIEASVRHYDGFNPLSCKAVIAATHACLNRLGNITRNDDSCCRAMAESAAKRAVLQETARLMQDDARWSYPAIESTLAPLAAAAVYEYAASRCGRSFLDDNELASMASQIESFVMGAAKSLHGDG